MGRLTLEVVSKPVAAPLPAQGAGFSLAALVDVDDADVKQRLTQLALGLQGSAVRLSDAIGQRYFAHADGGEGLQRV